jgi:hypothetical protein
MHVAPLWQDATARGKSRRCVGIQATRWTRLIQHRGCSNFFKENLALHRPPLNNKNQGFRLHMQVPASPAMGPGATFDTMGNGYP